MKIYAIGLAVAVAMTSVGASATTNLVTNGGFELLTNGPGQLSYNTDAIGWSNVGVNYVMDSATADSTGVLGQFFSLTGNFKLWGPANGNPNGLGPSPDGGNFVAAEGRFRVGPISQVISGLTVGRDYLVNFYWGGAQQRGVNGATTENFTVGFGNDTQATATLSNVSHGFTGWQYESFRFTAQQSSQVLSFLAGGGPKGLPPISLLDGVSVTAAVPEPATWAMLIAGFGLVGLNARRRRAAITTSA